jgi:hypothetical protein
VHISSYTNLHSTELVLKICYIYCVYLPPVSSINISRANPSPKREANDSSRTIGYQFQPIFYRFCLRQGVCRIFFCFDLRDNTMVL